MSAGLATRIEQQARGRLYSPELNPVEELWHELPRHFPANRVIDTLDDLIDACCKA